MTEMEKLYRERTGKLAQDSVSSECGLAMYIETYTSEYIRWLEKLAAQQIAAADIECEHSYMDRPVCIYCGRKADGW